MSQINAPLSAEAIAVRLMELPAQLIQSDLKIAGLEASESELKEGLELAELNASLSAGDGKNAEERKLKQQKAIAQSQEVVAARGALGAKRAELELERVTNKALSREFAAACRLADLSAARMLFIARGATQNG